MSRDTREDIAAGEAALREHYDRTRGSRRQTRRHRFAQFAAPVAVAAVLWAMVPKGGESADPNSATGDSGYSDATGGSRSNGDINTNPDTGEGVVPTPSSTPSAAGNLYCKLAGVTAITSNGRTQTVIANMDIRGARLGDPNTFVYVPLVQEGMIVPGSDANAKPNQDQSVTVTIPADSGPEDVYGLYLSAPDANNDGEPEEASCGGFYMDNETASVVSVGQLLKQYES